MIATAPMIQVVDWLYPCSPIQIDTRPILCRGLRCNCREYAKYGHIAGYDYCACKHSFQTHRHPNSNKKKAVKR